jgi:uncharacterized protein GlcG (DUF336 family)
VRDLIEKAGGRKWVLSLVILAIGTVALFLTKLSGAEWVTLALGVGAAYGAANAATHRGYAKTMATAVAAERPKVSRAPLEEEMMDVGH